MNKTKTKGKVLVCRHVERSTESKVAKSKIVKEAGGVGMILIDEADQDVAIPFVIPSAIVGKKKGQKILSYLKTTRFVYSLQINYTFMDLNPLQVVWYCRGRDPLDLEISLYKYNSAYSCNIILQLWRVQFLLLGLLSKI